MLARSDIFCYNIIIMLIIDGHNAINLMPNMPIGHDHWKPFIALVEKFALFTGKKIIVALDLPGDLPGVSSSIIKIICHQPADEVIKQELERYQGGSGNCLVSSDRELKQRAHACGFRTVEARDFIRELQSMTNADASSEKPQHVSPQEIAYWEKTFAQRPVPRR